MKMENALVVTLVLLAVSISSVAAQSYCDNRYPITCKESGYNPNMCHDGDDFHVCPESEGCYQTNGIYISFYEFIPNPKCVSCLYFTETFSNGCMFSYDPALGLDETGRFREEAGFPQKYRDRWDLFINYGFHPSSYVTTRYDSPTGPILAERHGNQIEWRFDDMDMPNPIVVKAPNVPNVDTTRLCCATYYFKLYEEAPISEPEPPAPEPEPPEPEPPVPEPPDNNEQPYNGLQDYLWIILVLAIAFAALMALRSGGIV